MSTATLAPAPRTAGLGKPLVFVGAALVLVLSFSAGAALLLGAAIGLSLGDPWPKATPRIARQLLTASVVALGAGMDLRVVAHVGLAGIGYTAAGIGLALAIGTFLGRRLRVPRETSLLLAVGTAICGGSAIAAVAPVVGAKPKDVSSAIVPVFLLNGLALFVFPAIGAHLHLGERAFGLWCALAIHDTSSVVGAAASYGREALDVATAAKLARALWIVPVTLGIAALRARTSGGATQAKPSRPWFIAGFLLAAAIVTYVPWLRPAGHLVASAAHRALGLTLFLIGLGLSRAGLRELGVRPMLQAIGLWIVLASASLAAITFGLVG